MVWQGVSRVWVGGDAEGLLVFVMSNNKDAKRCCSACHCCCRWQLALWLNWTLLQITRKSQQLNAQHGSVCVYPCVCVCVCLMERVKPDVQSFQVAASLKVHFTGTTKGHNKNSFFILSSFFHKFPFFVVHFIWLLSLSLLLCQLLAARVVLALAFQLMAKLIALCKAFTFSWQLNVRTSYLQPQRIHCADAGEWDRKSEREIERVPLSSCMQCCFHLKCMLTSYSTLA